MARKRKNAKGNSKQDSYQTLNDNDNNRPPRSRRKSTRKKKNQDNPSVDDFKLRQSVEQDGYTIIDMSPDGNCLFRALSDQLHGDYGNNHEFVRSEICDFMEQNKEDFEIFLVFEDDEGDSEDAEDFESYISNMRTDGEWGGNLELVAAARYYRCVHVILL